MTQKSWAQLTTDEKLEILRADMNKIYGAFNALASDVGHNHTKLNEVAKAVESLKRRPPETV